MPRALFNTAQPPVGQSFGTTWASSQIRGLIGWWPVFGSAGAARLADRLFQNLHATLGSGAGWSTNPITGHILSLDGTANGYAEVGDVTVFDGLAAFTTSCWVYQRTLGAGRRIIDKWGPANTDWSVVVSIEDTISDSIIVGVSDIANNLSAWHTSDAGLVAGQTFHLAVTWQATSDIAIYVDGRPCTLVLNVDQSVTAIKNTASVLRFGNGALSGNAIDGGMADVRIYNRVLPPAEVWQLSDPKTRWDLYQPVKWRTPSLGLPNLGLRSRAARTSVLTLLEPWQAFPPFSGE